QDKSRCADPAGQRQHGAARLSDRTGEDPVQQGPQDERGGGLDEPEQRLVDEVPHGRRATASSWRPCIARTSVTSSAYSRSPPTGIPRAMRDTEPTCPVRRSATYIAVASPSSVGSVAR